MEICYVVIDRAYLRREGLVRAYRFGRYFFNIDDVLHYFRVVDNAEDLMVITAPKSEVEILKERNDELCI